MAAVLRAGLLLPQAGYEPIYESSEDVIFSYSSDGLTKVAIHVGRGARGVEPSPHDWTVWSLHACDHGEYGADVELDAEFGVWRNWSANRILIDFAGWGHCEMETARFLPYTDRLWYVRDPAGRFDGELLGRYRPDATLPDDALDTGYRRGTDELWLSKDGRAAYVAGSTATERWPRYAEKGGPGCA